MTWMLSGDQGDPLEWLAQLTRRPSWHTRAACRGMEPATFVLSRGANESVMARARAICAGCPVTVQCLDYAMSDTDLVGVWAGTSGAERRAMRAAVA